MSPDRKRKSSVILTIFAVFVLAAGLAAVFPGCDLFMFHLADALGDWQLYFDWNYLDPGDTTITYDADGTFATGDASTGTWSLSGRTITFQYTMSPRPRYIGTMSDDKQRMDGTMNNTEDPSKSGTWYALKK
jgi:hypothetical protein